MFPTAETDIKFMTDGVLLKEVEQVRMAVGACSYSWWTIEWYGGGYGNNRVAMLTSNWQGLIQNFSLKGETLAFEGGAMYFETTCSKWISKKQTLFNAFFA